MSFASEQIGSLIAGEVELYEIDYGDVQEYFTTRSRDVTLPAGHDLNPSDADITYLQRPVGRDRRESKGQARASTLKITMPTTPGVRSIQLAGGGGNPTLKVIRGFGDPVSSPENFKRYWFSGIITDLGSRNNFSTLTVSDERYVLSLVNIQRLKATRQCNWSVYETGGKNGKCDLVEASFTYGFDVRTVLDSGETLVLENPSSGSSGQENEDEEGSPGYFTLGKVWETANPANVSMISSHSWDGSYPTIQLHRPLAGIVSGSEVSVSWGCDWRAVTCRERFNNLNNMVAFPELPLVNPATTPVFNK